MISERPTYKVFDGNDVPMCQTDGREKAWSTAQGIQGAVAKLEPDGQYYDSVSYVPGSPKSVKAEGAGR